MEKGTAYGFFHCEALKVEIEREIPALKVAGRIPNLDVIVIDTTDLLKLERDVESEYPEEDQRCLASFIGNALDNDLNYVLKGTLAEETNFETARQVSHFLMQMNQSYLDRMGEVWGNVIYKDADGKYIFL